MAVRSIVLAVAWLLMGTIVVSGSPVGDCPPVDPLDHTDHLPDDKNCSLFYKCDHASPVLFACPKGLHFNRLLEVCDWPDAAGCTGNTESTSSAAPTASPNPGSTSTSTDKPTSDAPITSTPAKECPAIGNCPQYEDEKSIAKHLPHATNCSQFCKCDHGKPVTFDCPAGLHFNAILEVCDWPQRAGCVGKPTTTAPNTTSKPTTAVPSTTTLKTTTAAPSTSAETTTAAPVTTARTTTTAPSTTSEPVTVSSTTARTTTAAPSTTSEATTDAPSSTAKPTTSAPISSSTAAPSSPATSKPSNDCPAVGVCPQYEDENSIAKHLPHATNCSQFCKCDHGKPVTFDCPAGLHFNAILEVCDWPQSAGCAVNATTTAPNTTSKPTTAVPSTTTPKTTTASPSTSAETTTAAPASDAPSTKECPAIGNCPQYEDEMSIAKHLPHATNCSQFCKCDHGKPVTFDCPAGLHFNAILEVCDWPQSAGCSTKSTTAAPTTSGDSTMAAASKASIIKRQQQLHQPNGGLLHQKQQ